MLGCTGRVLGGVGVHLDGNGIDWDTLEWQLGLVEKALGWHQDALQ